MQKETVTVLTNVKRALQEITCKSFYNDKSNGAQTREYIYQLICEIDNLLEKEKILYDNSGKD